MHLLALMTAIVSVTVLVAVKLVSQTRQRVMHLPSFFVVVATVASSFVVLVACV